MNKYTHLHWHTLSILASAFFGLHQYALAADSCEVTVEATDSMTFTTKEIAVPKSCKAFSIHLKHTGTMSKNIMGHNLVVSKQTDQQPVLQDGMKAGASQSFVKPQDVRVLAFTALIGGGEQASTTFSPAKLEVTANYVFFCSFPGHASVMKGAIKLI
ncbi:azurin [Methylophilus aquaticus]|uniref:Azurin n=1 Tax=Methylophilus aquaticus TaxID=1971610 RepID=A0ABT9JQ79_9PROT|nr:azurin [Methylophilus aquaticus]MDP8566691.1 azurin [Methylophilus aquaticus]